VKRNLSEQEIRDYDAGMKIRYPGFDVFFPDSAAAILNISRRTFQNMLSSDPNLGFVGFVEGGGIATCTASMQACKAKRPDRRHGAKPTHQFTGGWWDVDSTGVGSGSVIL